MDVVIVPALAGGYAYAGSKFIMGDSGNVTVGGTSIDKSLATAGVVGASALIAQTTKDFIIPKIPVTGDMKRVAQGAVGPALCGGSTALLQGALISQNSTVSSLLSGSANQSSMLSNFVLGAGSYVAADYTHNMIFKK